MAALDKPLNDKEMLKLSRFLDSGSASDYSLVELNGFLHGILCLPNLIKPSEWLQEVLSEKIAENQGEMEEAFNLILRYYNSVASALKKESPKLHLDGSLHQSLEWFEGFGLGFIYQEDALLLLGDAEAEAHPEDENILISAIVLAFSYDIEDAPESQEKDELLNVKKGIENILTQQPASNNISFLKEFALSVQELLEPARELQRQAMRSQARLGSEPKRGRNDPCHCGSGKKYKHCHGKK